jgi:hypothetical protein
MAILLRDCLTASQEKVCKATFLKSLGPSSYYVFPTDMEKITPTIKKLSRMGATCLLKQIIG